MKGSWKRATAQFSRGDEPTSAEAAVVEVRGAGIDASAKA